MADVQKIILIPRYTSFVGLGTFYTTPINVREFCHADVSFWRGNEFGTITTLGVGLEQSPDLTTWTGLASFTTAADDEDCQSADLTMEWLRMAVYMTVGTDPAFSCWAVGNFERRRSPAPPRG